LSGGNLQKFIVGREIEGLRRLAGPPQAPPHPLGGPGDARVGGQVRGLLIVSQPTWGVDVGAAAQIRGEILALRDAGCAVLVVSEELEELFEISDRLHVIAKGRLSPSLARAEAGIERIGEWMSGLWEAPAAQNNQQETAHAAA